jgi:hypothetical protein
MIKHLKNALFWLKNHIKMPKIKITDEQIRLTGVITGFFMVFRGLWLIYEPLAWLICGIFLMWVFWPGRR